MLHLVSHAFTCYCKKYIIEYSFVRFCGFFHTGFCLSNCLRRVAVYIHSVCLPLAQFGGGWVGGACIGTTSRVLRVLHHCIVRFPTRIAVPVARPLRVYTVYIDSGGVAVRTPRVPLFVHFTQHQKKKNRPASWAFASKTHIIYKTKHMFALTPSTFA